MFVYVFTHVLCFRLITNSGTWMLVLVPTYSTKIFIGQNAITTYVIPFVIGILLTQDSIIGVIIPSSCYLLSMRWFSLEEERVMQQSSVSISLSF